MKRETRGFRKKIEGEKKNLVTKREQRKTQGIKMSVSRKRKRERRRSATEQ